MAKHSDYLNAKDFDSASLALITVIRGADPTHETPKRTTRRVPSLDALEQYLAFYLKQKK